MITTLFAVAMLAAFGIFRNLQTVQAFNPQPDPPGFGLVGITLGQTLRINVVNTAEPDTNVPPGPCRVVLNFRNIEGDLVLNRNGEPLRRIALLQPGQSAFLELDADNFPIGAGGRHELRPVARVQQADPNGGLSPDPCIPTAEVFNNATGRTQFLISALPAVQRPATIGGQ